MPIASSVWAPERARLIHARDNPGSATTDINTAIANLDAAFWERVTWSPRCAYGYDIGPDGYAYIGGGWNCISSPQVHFGDVWRTKDFMVAERAKGVSFAGRSYCGAAFASGKFFVGPGYDDQGTDKCTRDIYGAVPGDQMTLHSQTSCYDHEAGMFHRHSDGKVYIAGGLNYTGSSPSYFFPAESFRSADFSGNLELRSSNIGLNRRSFGYATWGGAIVCVAGRNDNGTPTNYADAWRSTDGLQTISQVATGLPFGGRYAFGMCVFKGRLTVGFGNNGSLIDDLWSTDDPNMAANSWVQHTNPGIGARSLVSLIPLVINGVETLGVIGGYGGTNTPKRDVWTTTDHGTAWTQLTTSDFHVP